MSLLRTKFGVVVMTVIFASVFFGVSKLKSHVRTEQRPHVIHPELSVATTVRAKPKTETENLLSRASENASDRATDATEQRELAKHTGNGYDEAGNLFHRRPIPDAVDPTVTSASVAAEETGKTDVNDSSFDVPTLRIHGRRPSHSGANEASQVLSSLTRDFPGSIVKTGLPLSGVPASKPKPTRFVPFGRLIKAELVITLESTQDEMPLIGLIVEPVYNNGKLVIPAGTEVHSLARPDRIRDRINSTTSWKMILPREGTRQNGRQLTFDGIALDREDRDGNGLTWDLTDGSYGLRGREIHRGQTSETLMLFAAEALKAASNTSMDRQQTILGSQLDVSARNDALAGGQAVLSHFAQNVEKEIERNGVYIQVPAGKQFYVYPRQVIDPDRADISDNVARVE